MFYFETAKRYTKKILNIFSTHLTSALGIQNKHSSAHIIGAFTQIIFTFKTYDFVFISKLNSHEKSLKKFC